MLLNSTQGIPRSQYEKESLLLRHKVEEDFSSLRRDIQELNKNKGSYEEAFRCFERGIQLDPNHPELQHSLGIMFANGQGVLQDYAEAAVWHREAAEQEYAGAQNNLGVLYQTGQGVPQNDSYAALWYRKAADHGNRYAQYNLGLLYHLGQGVPQDHELASVWLRQAAAQGVPLERNSGRTITHNEQIPPQTTWKSRLGQAHPHTRSDNGVRTTG